jgi:hypothetical protein
MKEVHWRTRATWVGVAMAVALLAAADPHPVAFMRHQYDRIRLGMTRGQVKAILGCSPGNYRSESTRGWDQQLETESCLLGGLGPVLDLGFLVAYLDPENNALEEWESDTGCLHLVFYKDKVVAKDFSSVIEPLPVTAANWVTWLRLLVGM